MNIHSTLPLLYTAHIHHTLHTSIIMHIALLGLLLQAVSLLSENIKPWNTQENMFILASLITIVKWHMKRRKLFTYL